MIGVILAAGRGARMKGLTKNRPKAMLPVVGLPIIAWALKQLEGANISEAIIVIAADDRHIRPYFAAHPPEIPLTFVIQSATRGMAHALLEASPVIKQPFIVTACDSLYPDEHYRRLAKIFAASNSPATLTLMKLPPDEIARASSVKLENERVTYIIEKPSPAEAPSNIASLSAYAFDTTLFAYLNRVQESKRGELELQDAIQMMIDDFNGLPGVDTAWRWELTAPRDLLDMNLKVLAWRPNLHAAPAGISATPPVFVESGAILPNDVSLGPNVYVEAGAKIGAAVTLANCVVLRDGVVGDGIAVEGKLISEKL